MLEFPKTIRIPLDANDTVALPDDYVQWVKISLLNMNGEVSTLRINNALTTYKDNNPDRLSFITPDIQDSWLSNLAGMPFLNYYINGGYAPMWGIAGGLIQYGECRVDEKNNVIIFSPNYQYQDVLLEYISCPTKDGDYMVDRRFREPLIAFMEWKAKVNTEQNYYARMIEARRTIKPVHLQTVNEVIRENEKFCLKS